MSTVPSTFIKITNHPQLGQVLAYKWEADLEGDEDCVATVHFKVNYGGVYAEAKLGFHDEATRDAAFDAMTEKDLIEFAQSTFAPFLLD